MTPDDDGFRLEDAVHRRSSRKPLFLGLVVGLVFVVIYLGLAHALHVREVRDLSTMVRQRVIR